MQKVWIQQTIKGKKLLTIQGKTRRGARTLARIDRSKHKTHQQVVNELRKQNPALVVVRKDTGSK